MAAFCVIVKSSHRFVVSSSKLSHLDEGSEAGSLLGVLVPAVEHHVEDLSVAVLRLLQTVALPHPLHHLAARHARVRGRAQGHDLPHQHTE